MEGTKKCPYCGVEIMATAKKMQALQAVVE